MDLNDIKLAILSTEKTLFYPILASVLSISSTVRFGLMGVMFPHFDLLKNHITM